MITRITGGWLPLSEQQLEALGWAEGQMVDIEVAEGVVILTPSQAPQPVPQPIPKRGTIGAIDRATDSYFRGDVKPL